METGHANFLNSLRAKGFANTGPAGVLEDTMLQRWRATTEGRCLSYIDRILAATGGGVQTGKKRNQYSDGGPAHTLAQVTRIVNETSAELTRKRHVPPAGALRPAKLGTVLFFEQQKVRQAKAALVHSWAWEEWQDFRQRVR